MITHTISIFLQSEIIKQTSDNLNQQGFAGAAIVILCLIIAALGYGYHLQNKRLWDYSTSINDVLNKQANVLEVVFHDLKRLPINVKKELEPKLKDLQNVTDQILKKVEQN